MAFLDDFGKMFAEGGQNTIQRGKDSMEISRLNSSMNELGRKVEGIYFHIGKMYAEKHEGTQDYEPELKEAFLALKEYRKQMEELQNRIQQIKGVAFCSQCGAQLEPGALFCSSCGHKIS